MKLVVYKHIYILKATDHWFSLNSFTSFALCTECLPPCNRNLLKCGWTEIHRNKNAPMTKILSLTTYLFIESTSLSLFNLSNNGCSGSDVAHPQSLHWSAKTIKPLTCVPLPVLDVLGQQRCLDRWCMSCDIHLNAKTQGLLAEHCSIP